MKINEIPNNEKPYEKMKRLGPSYLSNMELLAIILRTGSKKYSVLELSNKVLTIGGKEASLASLHQYTCEDYRKISGIGSIKAIQIKALLELSTRIAKDNYPTKPLFNKPELIAGYFMEDMRHLEQEELWLLSLDIRGRMISQKMMFRGTISSCAVSAREIFIAALEDRAVRIILMHNHPSGNPEPSGADIDLTKRVAKLGLLLEIELWDHLIIGDRSYFSLKEKGLF